MIMILLYQTACSGDLVATMYGQLAWTLGCALPQEEHVLT